VSLEYENGQDSFPKSVVVKTPSPAAIDDLMKKLAGGGEYNIEESMQFVTMGHSIECAAYRTFGRNPPIPLPIIYAATDCQKDQMGAIVMEDLSGKATIVGDPTCTLSLEQLYETADAVASWHAWCLTTDTDWQSHFEPMDSERRTSLFKNWFEMMKNCFERAKAKYPGVFDKIDAEVAQNQMDMEKMSKTFQKHRTIIPDVIVHGDFYGPNLMFQVSKDASGKDVAGTKLISIIDWPLSHSGNGMDDFARLLTVSADTETRRKHTKDILRRYYDTLVKKAGADKIKASFEDILNIYDDYLVMAGMFFVLMLDWLQNLWVTAQGEEGEKKKHVLYERCLGVYEDMLPIMEKAGRV